MKVRKIVFCSGLLLAAVFLPGLFFTIEAKAADKQIILLKLDDIVQEKNKDLAISPRWQKMADFIMKNKLKAGFGIIGSSLEQDNPAYFKWIKDLHEKGIEFWHHGYGQGGKGEFEKGSMEEQKALLDKTEKLAKEKLGFSLPAFGPHYTATTDETEKALEAIPEIKIWLYGPKNPKYYKKLSIPRYLGLENPTFVPDFEKFKASYEKLGGKQPVLVLQGHPNGWDDSKFSGFVKIIEYLKSKDCVFMTPSEYYEKNGGK